MFFAEAISTICAVEAGLITCLDILHAGRNRRCGAMPPVKSSRLPGKEAAVPEDGRRFINNNGISIIVVIGTGPGSSGEQGCDGALIGPPGRQPQVNVRRLLLDVDKAVQRPDILELAQVIDGVPGVEAVNITVTDIDIETVGTDVTFEGDNIDIPELVAAIENVGAAVHSIDEIVVGDRIIERVPRAR